MKKKTFSFNPIWLIAPVITAGAILVLYYLKDVYPFGNSSIVAYDWYNGGFSAFLHNYDAWHSGNLFYDFTTAAGFGRSLLLTVLQPQYVFTLLWERENLIDAMSILVLLKFVIISFTASYGFSKIFPKVSNVWVLCGALMYTFSGFNIMYYTNIDWLDTVALFPLLVVCTLNLFKGRSKLPFFLIVAYMLITNVYTAFFVIVALVVFGGLYIFIIEEKENRKLAAYNLGVGTGAALVAGAFSIWVFVSNVLSTKRFESETASTSELSTQGSGSAGGFLSVIGSENQIDIVAVFMFLGMAISITSLIVLWFRFKSHKDSRKYTIFFSITMLLFVLQVVFKGVMLLWHAGSYQRFPFRNGYMVAFFCVCILLYYQQEFGALEGVNFKRPVLNLIPFIPCFFIGIGAVSYATVFFFSLKSNFKVLSGFIEMQTGSFKYPYACFAALLVLGFVAIKFIHYKKVRSILSVGIVGALLFANFYSLLVVNKPESVDSRTKENIYELELDIRENVKDCDALSRVKNNDVTRLVNYGYVAGLPTLSNWTHTLSKKQINAVVDLGYTNSFTLILDSGGTVFSDALLRITNSFADAQLNERLYEKYATSYLNANYYKNRYVLPVGIACDETIKEVSADEYENTFEYQNAIYRSISNDTNLFTVVSDANIDNVYKTELFVSGYSDSENAGTKNGVEMDSAEKQVCTSTFKFSVSGENVLYFSYKKPDEKPPIKGMKVNGEPVYIYNGQKGVVQNAEDITAEDTSYTPAFPCFYNNNVLELGVFEDEEVTVTVQFSNDEGNSDSVILYTMSLDKMKKLCASFDVKEYSVEKDVVSFSAIGSEDSDIAFVPLGYSENWECQVNGKSVEPSCVLGNFIGVEIEKGNNEVVLNYSHKPATSNILKIVILFLVGLVILLIERKIKMPKAIYNLTFVAFAMVFVSGMIILYVVPVGYSLITLIK